MYTQHDIVTHNHYFSRTVPAFPPAPGGRQRAPFEASSSFDQPDIGGGVGGLGLEEAFTPELKEKMVRLEKENEIMRRRLDSNLSEAVEPSLLGKDMPDYRKATFLLCT